ncbi:hypothetical protein VZT92_007073 [Zoarces viviparus]|uniref:Uncharacterized protein n=1 Tax=Zoarces viviparus TaxID=48416 RepID=A0AAW1FJ94_ZOAVI
MTDGEGRVRFQYAECPEGQEEVRLAIPTPYRSDAPGHAVDPGGGHDEEEKEEVERRRRRRRRGDGAEWSLEVQEHEDQEPELEVEVGPTFGVRIRAPIRDPDCVSEEEEEEQQPYPALAPVAFFCLKQTTRPRNWCLRLVCNPYPFTLTASDAR